MCEIALQALALNEIMGMVAPDSIRSGATVVAGKGEKPKAEITFASVANEGLKRLKPKHFWLAFLAVLTAYLLANGVGFWSAIGFAVIFFNLDLARQIIDILLAKYKNRGRLANSREQNRAATERHHAGLEAKTEPSLQPHVNPDQPMINRTERQ